MPRRSTSTPQSSEPPTAASGQRLGLRLGQSKPDLTNSRQSRLSKSGSGLGTIVSRLKLKGLTGSGTTQKQKNLSGHEGSFPFAILAVVFLVVGLWLGSVMKASLERQISQSLRSVLSANVNSVTLWMNDQKMLVSRLVASSAVQNAAADLIAQSGADFLWERADLEGDDRFQTISKAMAPGFLANDEYLGWCLVRSDHLVVASNVDAMVGQSLPIREIKKLPDESGKTSICLTMPLPVAVTSRGPLSVPGGPVMGALAPVQVDGESVGGFVLLLNPLGRFSKQLSIVRVGKSNETYAFDRGAILMSRSRFEAELRQIGLLDDVPSVASPLNVSLRVPPEDLMSLDDSQSLRHRTDLPLSTMADDAIRGGTGENVKGYRNYRGANVVGAWTWLPEYGMGVATELDREEGLRPIRLLERFVNILLGLSGLTALGVISTALITRRAIARSRELALQSGQVGQYELTELLGRGGMGAVYRGTHHLLQRPVAIKVLSEEHNDTVAVSRFEREVQMTASLMHPNTITIHDYGRAESGTFFYVMEYISGMSLQELIDRFGRQPPGRVIHLLLQICGSLAEAHDQDLVHRDIKPANVLIARGVASHDHVKVLDFGLIKSVGNDQVDAMLTRINSITGTPMYMSPEAVRDAAAVTPQSDLYSIGSVGYALLTGLPIFAGGRSADICLKQINEDPMRPSERCGATLPEDLQNVLMECLRKDPQERPRSAEDLATMLRSCEDFGTWSLSDSQRWWEKNDRNENKQSPDTVEGSLADVNSLLPAPTTNDLRDGTRTES